MELPSGYILIKETDYLALLKRLDELESGRKKNSSNSSKPPSSDGFQKVVKNNREKSSRKSGAQPGHTGTQLKMAAIADKIETHHVVGVCPCGNDLEKLAVHSIQRRQVIDLPQKLIEITEHQLEVKHCSCGEIHYAEQGRLIPVQYGEKLKALGVYMTQYQLLPYERTQDLFTHIFGINISDGLLQNANERCYQELEDFEVQIKETLKNSAVIHNDETGMRCEEKLKWVHSCSTDKYTYYSIEEKRGREAIDAMGILSQYKGVSVHDRYSSYDHYSCKHALCNAHLLRDLKYLHEEENKTWAGKMIALLIEAKDAKNQGVIKKGIIHKIESKYNQIIRSAIREEPPEEVSAGAKKRGRKKKSKSLLLIETFKKRKQQILMFLKNPIVPFDNNQAERDLRMIKLKQKISGCFRTLKGAKIFCRIRSYISTIRKQGLDVLDALTQAIQKNPLTFAEQ